MVMVNQSSQKWDLKRFWQTVTYFEVFPFLGTLKRWLNKDKNSLKNSQKRLMMSNILVIGATGGVGKRVVRQLVEKGYGVRALVRDSNRAKTILGDSTHKIELFEGDVTLPETLTPALMENITAIISALGVKVQPIEGDTPTREKYYQGIKFYLPEVVDSPEKVEYEGNQNLINLAKKYLKSDEQILFDFNRPNHDLKNIWGALDDVVMGGASESQIYFEQKKAIFSGHVSIANNGGFASFRSKNLTPPLDLSAYQGILLRVKGDGKRYKFIVRCEGKWDGIGYCYSFDTSASLWKSVYIPFSDLIPVFRAKTVPEMGKFDPSTLYSLQLMYSKFEYDGQLNSSFSPGRFSLEIESIKAYGKTLQNPQFVMVSSAGVTRPGRPDLDLEKEPPAVRLNEQLGGILTWKLQGENVIRNSGFNYTIIRPCALTEKPDEYALSFDQGDNIKGQISRDAIANLCVEALTLPEATHKTFEVKETDSPKTKQDISSMFSQLTTKD